VIFSPDCLAGRLILVTGASSGLGRETAIQLSRVGARVALTGRNQERLEQTRAELQGDGHLAITADLSSDEPADALVKQVVSEGGPLHGIFYSAGESVLAPVRTTKKQHLDAVFGSGVFGAFGVARACSRKGAMVDGGSLVFMSSVSATRGRRGMAAYSAAKAAIGGLVRTLANELAPRAIRVNAIAAGAIVTAMHEEFAETVSDEMVTNYQDLHLLGFGRPDDVANAAIFLLSDGSRWITGTNLPIDGGYTAK
jgi:NAD(P)-dependent dehydrogenase (short-subunit alcohol dehydrogenase family)